MRNLYLTFFSVKQLLPALLILASATSLSAQTPMYFKTGTGTSGNTIPWNQASQKTQLLYRPTDFSTLPVSGDITKVYFRNSAAGTTGTFTDLKISFIQNNDPSFPSTSFYTGLSTAMSSASFVVNGNATAGGWFEVQLPAPYFQYDNTKTLVIEIQYTAKTGGLSTTTSTSTGNKRCSGTSLTATTGTTNTTWNDFGMDVVLTTPCTSPPVPGAATAAPSTPVCAGTAVTLGLTGQTSGTGQTYTWQSASSAGGTYNNINSPGPATALVVTPTVTTFYRVAVTCGASTEFSAPVEVTVSQPLAAGTYTINPVTGDYHSLTEAVNALSCGITGPVVFNVDPGTGPYNEQISIPAIPGASAVNTITFNGNDATIQATPVTGTRHIIRLDGADYITIKKFSLIAITGSTFGWGVHLTNDADNNKIDSCIINMSAVTSTTQSNSAGIAISGSATSVTTAGSGSNNVFSNNTIIGGWQGVIISGTATSLNAVNNIITKNIIQDFYSGAVILTHNNGAVVSLNDISRITRTASPTTIACIELGTGNRGCKIDANRIHDTHTSSSTQTTTAYGIYANACDAPAGSENKVTNNLLYNFNSGSGTIYGLYNAGSDSIHYYHNTVVLDNAAASAGTTRGFYQTTAATGIIFKNNIIYIARGGTGAKNCVYFGTTTSTIVSNKNVLYMISALGTNGIGSFGTTNFVTLADWMTANANAYDQQSVSEDPMFVNPGGGDFTPSAAAVNSIGDNVGVATDITGAPRNLAHPDPGAYEYSLAPCINPPTPGIATTNKTVACLGESFTLDLVGNSVGDNQTYQWQVSPDNGITPWVNAGPSNILAPFTLSQTTTAWYRAVVTCGAGAPVNSTSVLVTTPGLVSGVFFINSGSATGGTNFQTFADAINYIKCGINGNVTFNVQQGTAYNEQVIIPAIPGASAASTITFNGNGAAVTFNSTSATDRGTIILKGADYIIIDSLQILATGSLATEYGYGVQILDNADNNTISRCTISVTTTPATASSTNFAGIVISAGTATSPTSTGNSQCDNNTLSGNTIIGGNIGISVMANGSTNTVTGNKVINNKIQDFYLTGIHINGNISALAEGNDISRPTRSSVGVFTGINMDGVSTNTIVSKNKIHNPYDAAPSAGLACYGIRIANCDATIGNENIISNNFIYSFNGGGTTTSTVAQNAILNNSSDHSKYYYNSILLDDASANCNCPARGFYVQDAAVVGIDFLNNNIVVGRGGTGAKQAVYFEPTSVSSYTINNNNYYLLPIGSGTVSELVHMGATATPGYTNLPAWQAASGKDANSYNQDPLYVSPADLHLQGSTPLDDKGTPVAAVTTDIDGHIRDVNTPDIGADELPLSAGVDIKSVALISPAITKNCYTIETITVRIKNNSTSAIDFTTNPVTVTVNVSGAATGVYTALLNTGSLAANTTQDVTMMTPSSTLDMTAAGGYVFAVSTSATGDVNTGNNALPVEARTKVALTAGTISASPTDYCAVGGMPTLTVAGADGYANIQWQQSTTTGTGFANIPGGTTSPYTVGTAITQTMYYQLVASCGANTLTSTEVSVLLNNPQVLTTAPGTRCGPGTVTLGATASGTAALNWYTSATGGIPLGTGTSFVTPVITTNTTYYVSASQGGTNEVAGRISPTATPNTTGNSWGLVFDVVTQPIHLNSVDIFSVGSAGGTISVELTDGAGTVIATAGPFTYPAGSTTTPVQVTLPVNLTIPVGTGYRLLSAAMSGGAVVRETSSITYPYTSPSGNVVITSGYIAGTTLSTYYWFYNWQISTGCEGPRTAIAATVTAPPAIAPVATPSAVCAGQNTSLNVTSANAGYTYTWTPGNLTGATQTVAPTATTIYTVNAIDNSAGVNNGCTNNATVTVTVNPVPTAVTITPATSSICTGAPPQLLTASGGITSGIVALSENFNGAATGWTTTNTTTGGTPALAAWTLRADGYTYGSTPVTFHSNDNSQFYLSNSDAPGSGSTTNTTLQSPAINLTNFTTATLDFWHFYRVSSAPESAVVEASTNGTTWTTLQTYTTLQGASNGFVNVNLSLNAFAGQPIVYIRFKYSATFDWYWAVDNVSVTGDSPAAVTWSPLAGLFTDAAGTIPYTGTATSTIYAGPAATNVYTATVTNSFGCTSTNTATVTITTTPSASISYAGSPYCGNAGTVTVTQTGSAGGTYTSTTGLSINATTGAVDLNASTPGTYTVTYSIVANGGCSAFSTTAEIIITAPPAATIAYAGSPYCTNSGLASVTHTGATGGTYSSTTGLSINPATGEINTPTSTAGTYTVTYTIAAANGCAISTTTASVTITPAPGATITYAGSPYCTNGGTVSVTQTGTAGGTYSSTTGLSINATTGAIDPSISAAGTYTITYTVAAANGCGVFTTTAPVTITQAPAATISYAGTPFCSTAGVASVTHTGTAGGTYSSTTGLTINSATGAITPGTSTAGTYTVTYTVAAANGCAVYTTTASVTVTAAPSATISYAGAPFCNSGTVSVTQTGTAGGTYSSTTGLSINATTGEINLGTSTAGTYTVTYTVAAAGGCAVFTATTPVAVIASGTWTGRTSTDWNTASNWCGGIPTATTDAIIPSTAPNMPNLSATGTVRNIVLNTGSSLTIATGGILNLHGSITGNGAFTATSGSIVFLGTTSQSVPAFTATNVTMNGNGGTVLGGNSSITGTLTLTNGHITLGSNNLTLAAGSTGSLASHIITDGTGHAVITGLAASATRVIPVGTNAGSYNPVTLQANAGHTTDNFTVRVIPGVYLNGASGAQFTEYVVDRTWLINEAIAGGSNVNVTLQWAGTQELPRFERTRSYVMQHNGTDWIPGAETAAVGTNPYTQTKTGVTAFSPFGVQKLPIPDAPTGIYPNPVVTILNVVVRPIVPEQMTLSVYDMSGKLLIVQRESVPGYPSILELNVTKLVAGMYILKVSTTRDKEFMVRKFLKAN